VKGERKMNSRAKGARGERELAKKLREYGYDCRRGQQYSGIEGKDVVGLPGIHIECKRVERLNIYDAIAQAVRDAKSDEKPAVFHRKNNCEWLVTMRLEDWIELYREWESGMYLKERRESRWVR
jgi:Holliday junction resolvase